MFAQKPVTAIRSIALDSSSRTSVTLMRVLCAQWFNIEPEFVTMGPDLPAMLKRCAAALPIGDVALSVDHVALSVDHVGLGLDKYDLRDEWRGLTGLPFVFAFSTGRPEALTPAHLKAIRATRDAGVAALDDIAAAH